MYKRELHLCKLRYVRDILNRARNLNRTSLIIQMASARQLYSPFGGKFSPVFNTNGTRLVTAFDDSDCQITMNLTH